MLLRAACAVQRAACTAALLLTAESCVLAALCARSEWQAALCVRQGVQQGVQGSWLQRQGLCGDGGTALGPAAGLTRRRPVCGRTQRPLLRGLPAQRHRSASLVGRSRIQRGTAATHRGSSKRCPGEALCPCEELQQPGRAAHAMPSTALRCAVSEDQEAHEHGRGRSVGMHAPVAAPGAGLRAPSGTPNSYRRLLPKCYALPLHMNHQQRKPTRPPTTTITATEMPAMAPEERLGSLPPAVPSLTSSRGQPVRQVDHSS